MYSQSVIMSNGDIHLSAEALAFFYELEIIIEDYSNGSMSKERARQLFHLEIANFEAILIGESNGKVGELEDDISNQNHEILELESDLEEMKNKYKWSQQNAEESDGVSNHLRAVIDELKGRLTIHGVDFSDIDE